MNAQPASTAADAVLLQELSGAEPSASTHAAEPILQHPQGEVPLMKPGPAQGDKLVFYDDREVYGM